MANKKDAPLLAEQPEAKADPPEPEVVEGEVVGNGSALAQSTGIAGQGALARLEDTPPPITFADGMQMLPVDKMQAVLGEYTKRRNAFREWLRSVLIEGVHYGFPPGCEPKRNAQGRPIDRKGNIIPPEQWQHKPSLYQAGADFLCDLLKFEARYEMDEAAWTQGGSQPGHYYVRCTIFNRLRPEQFLGEGVGSYQKSASHDENAAIKMAKKNAKVGTVLDVLNVSDLFTQDLENRPQPSPQPDADPTQPDAPTRAEREATPEATISERVHAIWPLYLAKANTFWKAKTPKDLAPTFGAYVNSIAGRDVKDMAAWDLDLVVAVEKRIAEDPDPRPLDQREGQ